MTLLGIDPPHASQGDDRRPETESRGRDSVLLRFAALAFELAPDGTVLSVNDCVQAATGYGALEGSNWWNLFFPAARAAQAARLRQRMSRGDLQRAPMVLIASDGRELHYELSTANRYGRSGELEQVVALAMPLRATESTETESFTGESARALDREPLAPFSLLETKRQLDLALGSAGVGTWRWDAASNAVTWDAQTHRVFGHDVGSFPGIYDSFLCLVHPDDRDVVNREATAAMRERRPYAVEFRVVWPDGSVHWVAGRGEVFGDAEGQLIEMRGACWDVTERRQASTLLDRRLGFEQLLASISTRLVRMSDAEIEEELRTMLAEIAAAMGADIACVALAAGRRGWDLLRASTSDLALSSALLEIARAEFRWHDPSVAPPQVVQSAALGDTSDLRATVGVPLILGQSLFGFIACAQRTPRQSWSSDEVLLLHLAGEMIMSDMLRRQEARALAALARVGRELITLADQAAIRERVCRLTTSALGCDAALVGEGLHEDDLTAVAQHGIAPEVWRSLSPLRLDSAERLRQQFEFAAALSIPLESADGMHGVLVALRRDTGFRPQEATIARGIAQLASFALANAQLVEKVGQANRIKSDFIATMSHELRTPLNIILGYTDLLAEDTFGPLNQEQVDTLARIGKSARNLLQMIEATLDAARIDAGHSRVCAVDVDPAAMLRDLDFETRELRQGRDVQCHFAVEDDVPPLCADGDKLRQILRNLVDNALKFTPAGRVDVTVRRDAGGICFAVADTGVGIPPAALPIIFDSFRQGDGSMTRHFGGVGLGLYIVRRLLDLMGGRVDVESEVGQGSTFRVWLPLGTTEGGLR